MADRSGLPTYDLFADLVDCHIEGDYIVLRLSKKNQPYLSAGELKRHFVGWQIALTVRKIKKIWETGSPKSTPDYPHTHLQYPDDS